MNRRVAFVLSWLILLSVPGVLLRGVPPVCAQTTSGGWQALTTLPYPVTSVARAPDASGAILAATDGGGIYLVASQGKVVRHLPSVLDGLNVTCMVFLGDKVVLVGTSERGLFKSGDIGETWTHVDNVDCSNIAQIRVEADRSAVFVASYCSGLHYSMDQGRSWATLSLGVSTFLTTDVVRVGSTSLILSTLDKGLFVSSDNGKLFLPLKCPVNGIKGLAYDAGTSTLYATASRTFAWSADKGLSWHLMNAPLDDQISSLVAAAGGRVIVGTQAHGSLVSSDHGKTFLAMSVGSSSLMIGDLSLNGSTLVQGSREGEVAIADMNAPFLNVNAVSISLGTVPSNKTAGASIPVRNVGAGTLSGVVSGSPRYLVFSPSAFAGNTATIVVTVRPAGLENRSYQSNVRLETNGGTVFLTIRFSVGPEAPTTVRLVAGSTTATIDGRTLTLDAASFIDKASGRMMVPFRFVAQAFGATVAWNGTARSVNVVLPASQTHSATSITLSIGSRTAFVNGQARTMDTAPQIRNSLTFVPLRFVSESLGVAVGWDAAKRQAILTFLP